VPLQLIIVSFVNVDFICSKSTAKPHLKVALLSCSLRSASGDGW
jgi:hypothetical protein